MVLPMVKELGKNVPPGKRVEYTVIMPPVSERLGFPDWQRLFSNIKTNYSNVRLVDYSELVKIHKDERVYFYIHQTDGDREFLIISAYEMIRGRKSCVGSIAFDIKNNEQYEMENVHQVSFEIDNGRKELNKKEKELVEIAPDWEYVGVKCPQLVGFKSFLGAVSPTFLDEMYIKTSFRPQRQGAEALYRNFRGTEALQVSQVCANFLKEKNLSQISLGDMAYVADLLDKDNAFDTVLIKKNRNMSLGTLSDIGKEIDLSRLDEIPSNYAKFSWKVKGTVHSFAPYFKLDKDKNTIKQIIESTVDHYSQCTTSQVAEDIMYLFNDYEPNAYFTAKVFMIMSAMDTLIIDSKDEFVESIQNVDRVEYNAFDEKEKELIRKKTKPVKKYAPPKTTIFKGDQQDNGARNMSIDQADFTPRTYNSLRRAGIQTIGELANKKPEQLFKIRNLGRNGVAEINHKLFMLGIRK